MRMAVSLTTCPGTEHFTMTGLRLLWEWQSLWLPVQVLTTSLLLVTDFYENGSLFDYLSRYWTLHSDWSLTSMRMAVSLTTCPDTEHFTQTGHWFLWERQSLWLPVQVLNTWLWLVTDFYENGSLFDYLSRYWTLGSDWSPTSMRMAVFLTTCPGTEHLALAGHQLLWEWQSVWLSSQQNNYSQI